ncbi:MAG: GatB/YqeY domain-containing protein [Candidimonas sp.]
MLIDKIQSDMKDAMRGKDSFRLGKLRMLYSRMQEVSKNATLAGNPITTDAEFFRVVEKFLKESNDLRKILVDNNRDTSEVDAEIAIYQSYLPKQMTEDDLKVVIAAIVDSMESPSMGDVMKTLKEQHGGTYDGKTASAIVKTFL